MKASIALSALSLSAWALAAPVVMFINHSPPKYSGPQITSADVWTLRQPSRFTTSEDAGTQGVLQGRPDNRPYRPTSDVAPSEALAAPRPLETDYLLSLKPILPSEDSPVTKPEEELNTPTFKDSSTVKQETGSIMKHHPTIVELETQANRQASNELPCTMQGGRLYNVRQHADATVVGIVLVLVAIIALIELWNPICRMTKNIWNREGRIRLQDERGQMGEKEQLEHNYPEFILRPAPKSRARADTTTMASNQIL